MSYDGAKQPRLTHMLDLLEELERNYTDMLHMFMNTSRRLLENATFVEKMAEVTKDVEGDDLRRVEAVKARLQRALTSVREDFERQTQQIIDSPLFSSELKNKVQGLRDSTDRLATSAAEGARA